VIAVNWADRTGGGGTGWSLVDILDWGWNKVTSEKFLRVPKKCSARKKLGGTSLKKPIQKVS